VDRLILSIGKRKAEMMDRIRSGKVFVRVLAGVAVFLATFWGLGGYKAEAEKVEKAEDVFNIEASLLSGGDGVTYDIRLTIQNNGGDWEGVVRLMVEDGYRPPCAYDTVLALPGGGKKQFTVKVPVSSLEDKRGSAYVVLVDGSGSETARREFPRFLTGDAGVFSMGILSDDYPSLTYLDLGGKEFYFYREECPVKLVELKQEGLVDALEGLTFLVIDGYSTEILTEEELDAIRSWNVDGGVLIVGTGAYAEETLGGFSGDYPGVESLGVYPPGEDRTGFEDTESVLDTGQLTMADLRVLLPDFHSSYLSGGQIGSLGDGAVAVLPYSLAELGKLDASAYRNVAQAEYVYNMLDDICTYAQMRYYSGGGSQDYAAYERNLLFGILGNSNNILNVGALKWIVILYVIFVGPVLYLLLKLLKKRELYWVAVPVSALLGIGLIYLAGRGFEVTDTRVYSVTLEKLAGEGKRETYLQCYDARHEEWQVKLSEDYSYMGPMLNYNYYYDENNARYYHHIVKDGNGMYFGIKPTSSFETCFFRAGGDAQEKGSVEISDLGSNLQSAQGLTGTVFNGTERSFRYFAVIMNDTMYVYETLPAGESRQLADLTPVYEGNVIYDGYSDYIYTLRRLGEKGQNREEVSARAALGIGICTAAEWIEKSDLFFMGVTEDYGKAVDDVCNELSYGCLFNVW